MSTLNFRINGEVNETFWVDDLSTTLWDAAGLSLEDFNGFEAYEVESQIFQAIKNLHTSQDYYELWAEGLGSSLPEVLDFLNEVLEYVRDVPDAIIEWDSDETAVY